MSNEAPFDQHSKESLEALAKVHFLCSDINPCRKSRCDRCKKRDEEWQNAMEQADIEFHMDIFGEVD